jgi:hypothetical protein
MVRQVSVTIRVIQNTGCEIHPSTIFGILASCIPNKINLPEILITVVLESRQLALMRLIMV